MDCLWTVFGLFLDWSDFPQTGQTFLGLSSESARTTWGRVKYCLHRLRVHHPCQCLLYQVLIGSHITKHKHVGVICSHGKDVQVISVNRVARPIARQPGMPDLQQMMVSIFLSLTYHMNFTNLFPFAACKLFAQKPAGAKVSQ